MDKNRDVKEQTSIYKGAALLVRDLFAFAIFHTVFTTAGFGLYHIPSGSMEPTLEVGDRIAVSKFAYGYNRHSIPFAPEFISENRILAGIPERGDVAVFNIPDRNNEKLIKRVIGLPGDRIQLKEGRLHINDNIVERNLVRTVIYTSYRGIQQRVKEYNETLPNGVIHKIYEATDSGRYDNVGPFIVPPGHYFMMGDNRDGSLDSRELTGIGYVPAAYLVGRAEITTFSLYDCKQGKPVNCTMNVPFGRMFTAIN